MAPFADGGRVIEVAGDEVVIPAGATITLSLMLHELAANSAKYGALAAADGRLVDRMAGRQRPDRRRGRSRVAGGRGAAVVPPTSTGFGSRLLKASARQLDARLEMDFAPTGLVCRLQFTVPRVGTTAPG